jgi:hypothetical protein
VSVGESELLQVVPGALSHLKGKVAELESMFEQFHGMVADERFYNTERRRKMFERLDQLSAAAIAFDR